MLRKISKLFIILSFPLILSACGGGGGGGGGAAGGGVGTGTVSYCSDTGTDYKTYEYYNGGSDLNQNSGNSGWTSMQIGSTTYNRTDATYSVPGAVSNWVWSDGSAIPSSGTVSVTFTE